MAVSHQPQEATARVPVTVTRNWGTGPASWSASAPGIGVLVGDAPSKPEAIAQIGQAIEQALLATNEPRYLVLHEDDTQTFVEATVGGVRQTRIRDGRVIVTIDGNWPNTKAAADEATMSGGIGNGPGQIVRL